MSQKIQYEQLNTGNPSVSSNISQTDVKNLAREAFSNISGYFKDPEHERAFQEWRAQRKVVHM